MKNYSYVLNGEKFFIDFENKNKQHFYELLEDNKSLYIYIDLNDENNDVLKIYYPKESYNNAIFTIKKHLLLHFLLFILLGVFISFLFSFYALYPLQHSYTILKEFMKDIIHDINTPISAMKLNLTFLEQSDEKNALLQSIQTLEMLHKNLDNYLKEQPLLIQTYSVKEIIEEQVNFFKTIYDWLEWELDIRDQIISTDKYLLSRILYNLLNNATKYNRSKGFIKIIYKNKKLTIQNPSYGIKNPSQVFERFYKESDRGLGIGLHIVAKLASQLHYKYTLNIDTNKIVSVELTLR